MDQLLMKGESEPVFSEGTYKTWGEIKAASREKSLTLFLLNYKSFQLQEGKSKGVK